MADPLAQVADLAKRVPGGIDDTDRAEAALEDASAAVRHAAGRSWTDDEPPDIAVTITLAAAKRIFANPHDYSHEQIGEYAWRGPSGLLTPEERDDLDRLAGDVVSVEMQTPYEVASTAQRQFDRWAEEDEAWPL